jgi:putative flippase GtrA
MLQDLPSRGAGRLAEVRHSEPLGIKPHHFTIAIQFVKFAIVGASNTAITFIVYTALLKGLGVSYLLASAIGFIAGATNGFLWNRRWTFSEHVGDAYTPLRWGAVMTLGLAIDEALLYLLVHDAGLDKLIAQLLAIVAVTGTTFALNRAWTFRVNAEPATEAGQA